MDMTGLSKAKLIKFSGIQNQEVDMRFIIPSGGMYGPYKVKGKLLKLSIEGRGQLKLTFSKFYVKSTSCPPKLDNLLKKNPQFPVKHSL